MNTPLFHDASADNTIATSDNAPDIEITVNGDTISEDAILEEMQYHPADNQRQAMIDAAESLVIKQVLLQRAKKLGLDDDDASDEALLDRVLNKEIDTPQADTEACERYYEQNMERFKTSPILEVNHILLAAAPDDFERRDQLKAEAANIIQILKETPHRFDDLCQQYSDCPSKAQGGQLGQISKGQTVPEFERVLMLSEPGLLDRAVESRYGFHVVDLHHKIPGQQLPFKAVEAEIKQYLDDKVSRKATAHYVHSLVQEADIEGFEFDINPTPLLQ